MPSRPIASICGACDFARALSRIQDRCNNPPMRTGSSSHRFSAWLAILVMALHALWPVLANAKPGSSSFVEVCTADGMRFVQGNPDAPGDSGGVRSVHCALCSLGADKVPPVPQTPLFKLDDSVAVALPLGQDGPAQSATPTHSPAHPRAPPAFS